MWSCLVSPFSWSFSTSFRPHLLLNLGAFIHWSAHSKATSTWFVRTSKCKPNHSNRTLNLSFYLNLEAFLGPKLSSQGPEKLTGISVRFNSWNAAIRIKLAIERHWYWGYILVIPRNQECTILLGFGDFIWKVILVINEGYVHSEAVQACVMLKVSGPSVGRPLAAKELCGFAKVQVIVCTRH